MICMVNNIVVLLDWSHLKLIFILTLTCDVMKSDAWRWRWLAVLPDLNIVDSFLNFFFMTF